MLETCYILLGGSSPESVDGELMRRRLELPLLGSTLGGIVQVAMNRQLGCRLEVVSGNGDGGGRSTWASTRLGGAEQRVSHRDERWSLLTDCRVTAGLTSRVIDEALEHAGPCDAALFCVGCAGSCYREEVALDGQGNLQIIRRQYTIDSSERDFESSYPHMLAVRQSVLASVLAGEVPAELDTVRARLSEAGIRLPHAIIPGRSYHLASDEDVLRLQADLVWRCRQLLPMGVRRALSESDPGHADGSVSDSAIVRGAVVLGRRVRIGSGAVVLGPCTIGDGAVIGSGCLVRNSVILPEVSLPAGQRVESSIVGPLSARGHPPRCSPQCRAVGARVTIAAVAADPVLPAEVAFRDRVYQLIKRGMDVAIAVVALLLMLPVLPLIALAIKVESRGPVFYVARRQTKNGRVFGCVKFRTMMAGADVREQEILSRANEVDGLHIKIRDDPRITRVGNWLRRTNVDEMPQFLNVLMGHMSVVGPRPSPDKENRICPGWREARLAVRAGITGLWQISRSRQRGESDFQEWIYYDIEYVRHQSLWLDVRIILWTVWLTVCACLPFLRRLGRRADQPIEPWWRPARTWSGAAGEAGERQAGGQALVSPLWDLSGRDTRLAADTRSSRI
jgi:lipopolysaccharide/colanic/teichoic acid biosynthesis glycosyltransferase